MAVEGVEGEGFGGLVLEDDGWAVVAFVVIVLKAVNGSCEWGMNGGSCFCP